MSHIISASLSPNAEGDDVWLAFRLLFSPWKWKRGSAVGKVEAWFRAYFDVTTAVSFNSGRSAMLAILRAFHIGHGDEVIVQAFTCVAVPNSVRWAGAAPVYADIDATLNMDPSDVARKISSRTRAIVVQHTFGIPAAMDELVAIAKKYKLILIEDCAHALGATYPPAGKAGHGKKVGSMGDAAFFSFGRDKVVSSVFGGLAIINTQCAIPNAKLKLKEYHKKLPTPSFGWVVQQLFHPVAFFIILPLYRMGIGKVLLIILQRLHVLGFPVYREEKSGQQPDDFPAKYPNALAILLLNQLKKLERFTSQRQEISHLYGVDKPYLRFPKIVDNPMFAMAKAKKQGILLGNWYQQVIDPSGVEFTSIGYTKGSCPQAEEVAKHIINLPTRVSLTEAKKVIDVLEIKA